MGSSLARSSELEKSSPAILDLDTSTCVTAVADDSAGTKLPREEENSGEGEESAESCKRCVVQLTGRRKRDIIAEVVSCLSCPICFESYTTSNDDPQTGAGEGMDADASCRSMYTSRCGHVLCKSCFDDVLNSSKQQCPLCRRKLRRVDIHPLYLHHFPSKPSETASSHKPEQQPTALSDEDIRDETTSATLTSATSTQRDEIRFPQPVRQDK
eukprot:Platyproteum_vivax@DN16884_c0_g1_i1.p1